MSFQVDDLSRARIMTRTNVPSPGTEMYVRHLDPAQVRSELRQARRDGLDNLVLTVGKDTFLASKASLDVSRFKKGQEVLVDQGGRGFKATVREINDEVNSDGDVLRRSLPCAVPGGIVGALVGGGAGFVVGANLGVAACMAPLTARQIDNQRR